MRKLINFIDNEKLVFATFFGMLILALIFSSNSKATLVLAAGATMLLYSHMFRASLKLPNSLLGSILYISAWLLIAPIIIPILLIASVSLIWWEILQDQYFIFIYPTLFIMTWLYAVIKFDLNRVKPAVQLVNGIILSVLAISFLTTFNLDFSIMVFGEEMIKEAIQNGIQPNSLFELAIKIITLPYVLSAIWAQVVIEVRKAFQNRTENCV